MVRCSELCKLVDIEASKIIKNQNQNSLLVNWQTDSITPQGGRGGGGD